MSESNIDEELVQDEPTDDADISEDDESLEGDDSDAAATEADGAERDREPPRRKSRRRRRSTSPATELTEDEQAARAHAFVATVTDKLDMACDVHLLRPKPDAESDISLEITGRDSGRIIGKKGQVLAALQFLANRVVNRPGMDRRYVTVDAEGYRSRRDSSLASMARRLGKQAITEGKIITFEPMNPRDRRVVHLALAKFEGVVTKSEGEGDQRRVQIIPVQR
jgi:spoIIIJ-associated protein